MKFLGETGTKKLIALIKSKANASHTHTELVATVESTKASSTANLYCKLATLKITGRYGCISKSYEVIITSHGGATTESLHMNLWFKQQNSFGSTPYIYLSVMGNDSAVKQVQFCAIVDELNSAYTQISLYAKIVTPYAICSLFTLASYEELGSITYTNHSPLISALPAGTVINQANINNQHSHSTSQIWNFPESMPANGGNADTVNGLTVLTAVPANAKFTDTIYNHPSNHPASIIAEDATHRFITDVCKTIVDWNAATTNGFYMGYRATNAPTSTTEWYFGLVITHNSNYVQQEVYQFNSSADAKIVPKYIRYKRGETWGAWTNVTVATAVPANAKFTDTIYTHPTTSGNKHIPSGGSKEQVLGWNADGTATWQDRTPLKSEKVKNGTAVKYYKLVTVKNLSAGPFDRTELSITVNGTFPFDARLYIEGEQLGAYMSYPYLLHSSRYLNPTYVQAIMEKLLVTNYVDDNGEYTEPCIWYKADSDESFKILIQPMYDQDYNKFNITVHTKEEIISTAITYPDGNYDENTMGFSYAPAVIDNLGNNISSTYFKKELLYTQSTAPTTKTTNSLWFW